MQNDIKLLRTLVDYTIERHYPHLKDKNNSALNLLEAVIQKQVEHQLILQ